MNKNQFEETVTGLLDECRELLIRKGHDYSNESDRLSNFKEAEIFTTLDRWQVWQIYFFKHLQAIQNHFKKGGLNEDIHHRIRDGINYLILLECLLVEEKSNVTVDIDNPEEVEKVFTKIIKDYRLPEIEGPTQIGYNEEGVGHSC